MSRDGVSGENPFAYRLPPSSCVLYMLKDNFGFCLLLWGHRSHCGSPTHMTSSKLNYLPKAPPPNAMTLGVRASPHEPAGMQTFSSWHLPFSFVKFFYSHSNTTLIKWSEVAQSCPTLCDPMDCSLPGSMGFSRQEYSSGLPFPSPGDLPHPGIEPRSPVLHAEALTSELPGKPQ